MTKHLNIARKLHIGPNRFGIMTYNHGVAAATDIIPEAKYSATSGSGVSTILQFKHLANMQFFVSSTISLKEEIIHTQQ